MLDHHLIVAWSTQVPLEQLLSSNGSGTIFDWIRSCTLCHVGIFAVKIMTRHWNFLLVYMQGPYKANL